ncbi:Transposase-like protein B [Methanosarcina lacustris Z-7289]|uniref:Transposase-like protein B n=1 Tax=Methanosarcina lacustris Z-7289 TaxID=1434111 RepID=A0A0E3WST3_9EURY|nr:RNA-guided endonuclease TnpB family protein [Methanosarcina lacustris]AKB75355.1 Transposase-like protein B [Methanosarcina lacustris Z-7289]
MQLAKKIRIYPTEEQVNVLWELSDKCRVVYNFALADRKDAYNKEKRSVKYTEQQNKLPDFKKRNPEYNVVYSKTLQGILKKLDSSYHSFFTHIKNGDKKARPPNFKGRNYLMTIPYNQSGFKIEDGIITFSHKVNNVPLSFEIGNLAEGLNVKQVEIVNDNPYKARGKFFLCIAYDVDIEDTYFDNGIYQAIDLGITKIVTAINTEGKFFEVKTPRPDNYWNQKIDAAKSRRDHCIGVKKGSAKSRRFLRIARAVTKMSKKKANQVKDFQHKLSKTMVENTRANTIIVGDLDVKQMAQPKVKDGIKQKKTKQKKGLNRSTQGLGNLGRFVQFLTYKAEIIGKRIIRIDEKNTTKRCCYCGKKHDMPSWKRVMLCDCGNNIDRDRNSAINIMIRYLLQNALWTGYQQFVDNLRQYRLPDGIEVHTEAK